MKSTCGKTVPTDWQRCELGMFRSIGGKAVLRFRAKSGLMRETEVTDKRLVALLRQLKKLRGAHVFQYRDDAGQIHAADSIAVNAYLSERTGHHFTAKDFRTWKAIGAGRGDLFYDERIG